jgi:predicted chitinase
LLRVVYWIKNGLNDLNDWNDLKPILRKEIA